MENGTDATSGVWGKNVFPIGRFEGSWKGRLFFDRSCTVSSLNIAAEFVAAPVGADAGLRREVINHDTSARLLRWVLSSRTLLVWPIQLNQRYI